MRNMMWIFPEIRYSEQGRFGNSNLVQLPKDSVPLPTEKPYGDSTQYPRPAHIRQTMPVDS